MRILFLDIDGVLNSTRWCAMRPRRSLLPPATAQEALDELRLEPACVIRLGRLVSTTGAFIVISSTWRKRMPVTELIELFRLVGFPDAPVIGVTPVLAGPRGDEVRAWLQAHEEPVEGFACLDDDGDYAADLRLVQTNADVGLAEEDVQRCLAALASGDPAFSTDMAFADDYLERNRNAFRELSKK